MRTPPEMTGSFLIQLVFMSGHQSVTPFLSGAPPPNKILDLPLVNASPSTSFICLPMTDRGFMFLYALVKMVCGVSDIICIA